MKEGEIFTATSGKKYLCVKDNVLAEIESFGEDGLPVLKTQVKTINEGFDGQGNHKISTIVNVPCFTMGTIPGNNG